MLEARWGVKYRARAERREEIRRKAASASARVREIDEGANMWSQPAVFLVIFVFGLDNAHMGSTRSDFGDFLPI